MSTSLREGLDCICLAEHYNKRIHINSNCVESPGAILLIKTGEQCTICGAGTIYEEFKRTGKLINFTGYGEKPKSFYEQNFQEAPLRMINFDQTFYDMPYDCRESKCIVIDI